MGDEVIKNNLRGTSRYMNKKGWIDPQGRKGKGYGVYRFANKYGANVDGYSPIYSPGEWSESGEEFTLGAKGLIAWAALLVVLLSVGINAYCNQFNTVKKQYIDFLKHLDIVIELKFN